LYLQVTAFTDKENDNNMKLIFFVVIQHIDFRFENYSTLSFLESLEWEISKTSNEETSDS